jgi:DNA modification methylase
MDAQEKQKSLARYIAGTKKAPFFYTGDAGAVLKSLPESCIDCCLTSPPYWRQRRYDAGGLGSERTADGYVDALSSVLGEVYRVLKPTGSLWLNLGDGYQHKDLLGIPWRVVFTIKSLHGWSLRNEVIWNKVKGGPDNSRDRLRNVHETLFHLVKSVSDYRYDVDSIRHAPRRSRVVNGAVVSATGVTGVRYRRQIELNSDLTDEEKRAAFDALEKALADVAEGRLDDFRMVLRKTHRVTHSDSESVSGRARELHERGFYLLRYHPKGAKPSDVWDIIPEDTHHRSSHFAAFPEDLCRIPILATSSEAGIVLDPFCGTGTTNKVACDLGRRSIGIDISPTYVAQARRRCQRDNP